MKLEVVPLGKAPSGTRRVAGAACVVCKGPANGNLCELASIDLSGHHVVATEATYESRQVIFREGSPATAVYCLRSGVVKLSKVGEMGEELIIRILGPGSLFGYRAVLAGETYAASAEAIGSTTICCVARESFLELLRSSAAASFQLLQRLANELRISEEQMLAIAQQTVRQRTIRLLCSFLYAGGRTATRGEAIPIPLMRGEMAQMIGTTPETLSRTLRQLVEEKVIRLTRTHVYVENAAGLMRLMTGPPLLADQDQV